jgi:hypothetical protein
MRDSRAREAMSGAVLGVEQALVVVARELGVHRQPHRRAVGAAAGKADREVHALVAARLGLHLLRILLRGQHLLQQRLQLHLAEHAARLHVGQHALQVAHALRQRLHLAQPLVHLLEPVGHLLEAVAQPLLERGLQLLVDGLAHLVELGRVGLLQLLQLRVQRGAHFAQPPGIRFAQALQLHRERVRQGLLQQGELLGEGVDLGVLRARGLGALLDQRILEGCQRQRELLAGAARRFADLAAQLALHPLVGGHQLGPAAVGDGGRLANHQDEQQDEAGENQCNEDPEFQGGLTSSALRD